jgi:hypothetical protein
MKKLAALIAVAAVALTPAVASAKPRAKTYKGTFQIVGADGSYTSDKFGKAQLVDGRRNDKLSVHVRKLGSRAKYVFRLLSAATACEAGAPAGTEVPGWTYRRDGLLVTSRKGVANSWARSRTFSVKTDVEYYVGVFTRAASGAPDQLVACAQLTTRKTASGDGGKSKDKPAKSGDKAGKPGKSGDKAGKPGKPEDKAGKPGKSEDKAADPGKSQDKAADPGKSGDDRGNSGEDRGNGDGAPGQGRKARGSRR